jgi:hypothetical protein
MYIKGSLRSKRQGAADCGTLRELQRGLQLVIVDLGHRLSPAQKELKQKYFRGYIPHVIVPDAPGSALYNRSGEVDDAVISNLPDKTLR